MRVRFRSKEFLSEEQQEELDLICSCGDFLDAVKTVTNTWDNYFEYYDKCYSCRNAELWRLARSAGK